MTDSTREVFAHRRNAAFDALAEREKASALVLPAAPVFVRNEGIEHDYRQDSDFYYLTGFEEPESVLVLTTVDRKLHLFVRPREKERELWDGPRAGVEGAKERYGADEAYPIAELPEKLPKLLQDTRVLCHRFGRDRAFDDRVLGAIEALRKQARKGVGWPIEIVDVVAMLHELRLVKSQDDLAPMARAIAITHEAHVAAMGAARPGMREYELEAVLLEVFRRRGADRVAYGSIVGSGPNATILHYRAGNRQMHDGELVLIDAGCEWGYTASDVTRVVPVSGKFTVSQRAVYELVLDASLAGIDATRVGVTLDDVHKVAASVLTRGLVRLGVLEGDAEKLVADEAFKPFYMHRTSHWLGMDVHDVGLYYVDGKPRPLQRGMVLTIEPGLYFGPDDERVPAEYRGIGVRIEDDVLVTDDGGPVVLTAGIPKTVAEVEAACAR